eukprot:gene30873-17001_t
MGRDGGGWGLGSLLTAAAGVREFDDSDDDDPGLDAAAQRFAPLRRPPAVAGITAAAKVAAKATGADGPAEADSDSDSDRSDPGAEIQVNDVVVPFAARAAVVTLLVAGVAGAPSMTKGMTA